MINSKGVKRFCSEDISEIENYEQAIADTVRTWHCHHRRETDENKTRARLIAEKLYWNRPASELIFLTKAEHTRLHKLGERNHMFGKHHSEETRKKMSMSQSGEKSYWFGKHLLEETRKKLSMLNSGKHHSEETRKKMSDKIIGMKYWNNGAVNKRSRECPGEGWIRGRLKRNQK